MRAPSSAMLRRPSPGETEEDLLRLQEEFLAAGGARAAAGTGAAARPQATRAARVPGRSREAPRGEERAAAEPMETSRDAEKDVVTLDGALSRGACVCVCVCVVICT